MPFATPPPETLDLGDGLSLLALQPEHAGMIFAVVDRNREHLRRWLPWVDNSRSTADTRAFLEGMAERRAAALTVAYSLMTGDTFRGVIGTHDINYTDSSVQIGYWIAKEAEGRGLMTCACRAMLQISFDLLEMERVAIRCAVGNTRSCAIPERLGFTFEGIERHGQRLNGEFVDLRIYSLLRGEYKAR